MGYLIESVFMSKNKSKRIVFVLEFVGVWGGGKGVRHLGVHSYFGVGGGLGGETSVFVFLSLSYG